MVNLKALTWKFNTTRAVDKVIREWQWAVAAVWACIIALVITTAPWQLALLIGISSVPVGIGLATLLATSTRVAAFAARQAYKKIRRNHRAFVELVLQHQVSGGPPRLISTPITITLPPPPPEVVERLSKLVNSSPGPVKVATVPEAINLPNIDQLLMPQVEAHARAQALAGDPIVYVEYKGVVAIIAQYGPFPIEREVVAAIAKEEILV
jgi:hypothetical protein